MSALSSWCVVPRNRGSNLALHAKNALAWEQHWAWLVWWLCKRTCKWCRAPLLFHLEDPNSVGNLVPRCAQRDSWLIVVFEAMKFVESKDINLRSNQASFPVFHCSRHAPGNETWCLHKHDKKTDGNMIKLNKLLMPQMMFSRAMTSWFCLSKWTWCNCTSSSAFLWSKVSGSTHKKLLLQRMLKMFTFQDHHRKPRNLQKCWWISCQAVAHPCCCVWTSGATPVAQRTSRCCVPAAGWQQRWGNACILLHDTKCHRAATPWLGCNRTHFLSPVSGESFELSPKMGQSFRLSPNPWLSVDPPDQAQSDNEPTAVQSVDWNDSKRWSTPLAFLNSLNCNGSNVKTTFTSNQFS